MSEGRARRFRRYGSATRDAFYALHALDALSVFRRGALMRIVLFTLLALSAAAFADGPGSRIRATPSGPVAPTPADQTKPVERDLQRCETLTGKEKDRCLRALHQAVRQDQRAPHEGPGPESTGVGSGGGVGSTSAPR
jgi:hypothetical protein